jgi:hypothetical protein
MSNGRAGGAGKLRGRGRRAAAHVFRCCSDSIAKLSLTRLAMYKWKKAVIINLPAIAAKLQELADRGGVGLPPHAVAIDRALAAIAAFNRAFKEARAVDPSIRYVDYLEARKAAVLETLARETGSVINGRNY